MTPNPRLMVLGGGSGQLRALARARKLGFTVICADRDPACPGREYANEFVEVSTFDYQGIVREARRGAVDAIYAIGSDQPILVAARVSEELGLPYPLSAETATAVTNKRVMKKRFAEVGIATARWCLLSDDPSAWNAPGLADLTPPYVAKPVDSQGQRGVARIATMEELEAHLPSVLSYSRESVMLVEEYYPSTEVTVSGWARNGEADIWTITDRVTIDSPTSLGVCSAHRFPSVHSPHRDEEIAGITGAIVSAFGIENAPIYFQMLVGDRGILVNEIASRLGGAYEDQSIPLVTGIDVLGLSLGEVSAAVRSVTAKDGIPEPWTGGVASGIATAGAFSVPLMFASPGMVSRYEGFEEMRSLDGVAECRPLLPIGTRILPMSNSTQRIAYAVIAGDTPEDVNTLVDTLFDRLRVLDDTGRNMLVDTREDCHVR